MWTLGENPIQELTVNVDNNSYFGIKKTIDAVVDRWAEITIVSGENQTGIESEADFENEDYIALYYPMFQLAIEYLVDEKGLGKSMLDIKAMFNDMLTTRSFSVSFEKHMGMSLDYYKRNFYTLITDYFKLYKKGR